MRCNHTFETMRETTFTKPPVLNLLSLVSIYTGSMAITLDQGSRGRNGCDATNHNWFMLYKTIVIPWKTSQPVCNPNTLWRSTYNTIVKYSNSFCNLCAWSELIGGSNHLWKVYLIFQDNLRPSFPNNKLEINCCFVDFVIICFTTSDFRIDHLFHFKDSPKLHFSVEYLVFVCFVAFVLVDWKLNLSCWDVENTQYYRYFIWLIPEYINSIPIK